MCMYHDHSSLGIEGRGQRVQPEGNSFILISLNTGICFKLYGGIWTLFGAFWCTCTIICWFNIGLSLDCCQCHVRYLNDNCRRFITILVSAFWMCFYIIFLFVTMQYLIISVCFLLNSDIDRPCVFKTWFVFYMNKHTFRVITTIDVFRTQSAYYAGTAVGHHTTGCQCWRNAACHRCAGTKIKIGPALSVLSWSVLVASTILAATFIAVPASCVHADYCIVLFCELWSHSMLSDNTSVISKSLNSTYGCSHETGQW